MSPFIRLGLQNLINPKPESGSLILSVDDLFKNPLVVDLLNKYRVNYLIGLYEKLIHTFSMRRIIKKHHGFLYNMLVVTRATFHYPSAMKWLSRKWG